VIDRTSGAREEIGKGLNRYPLGAGDTMTMLTAGGGGWGDPAQRDPARVREDVRHGYITPEAAQRDYGITGYPREDDTRRAP